MKPDLPPLLTARRGFPRSSPEAIKRLEGVPTGWIADANGRRGALDHRLRPLTQRTTFVGSALTVWTRACDNLAPYAAISFAQPGDVLMIATDDFATAAVAGDVLAGMARNKGIVAIVTDGLVRDIAGLDATGIPVFARGLTPNSPHKDGPGEIGLPISMGGVAIEPGDLVAGDADGCVVVSRSRIDAVREAVAAIRAKEDRMDAIVQGGATAPEWLAEILRSRVRYCD